VEVLDEDRGIDDMIGKGTININELVGLGHKPVKNKLIVVEISYKN